MEFEAEGREFAKIFEITKTFIQTVKGQKTFGNRMFFQLVLGGSSDLIHSNWKKYLGFRNLREKLENEIS